jgi:hypothetical protein
LLNNSKSESQDDLKNTKRKRKVTKKSKVLNHPIMKQ